MITEAQTKIKSEVRAHTYQVHAVRCTIIVVTETKKTRRPHTTQKKYADRMKEATRRRKTEIEIEKNQKSKRKERKVIFEQESKKENPQENAQIFAYILQIRKLREGCRTEKITKNTHTWVDLTRTVFLQYFP